MFGWWKGEALVVNSVYPLASGEPLASGAQLAAAAAADLSPPRLASAAPAAVHAAHALACVPRASALRAAPSAAPAAAMGSPTTALGLGAPGQPAPAPPTLQPAPPRAGRCQVGGCSTPYEQMRPYNKRCRLCTPHMQSESLLLGCGGTHGAGAAPLSIVRFCQKCNRLQPLDEFEGSKRTCAAQLETHNQRRREIKRTKGSAERLRPRRLASSSVFELEERSGGDASNAGDAAALCASGGSGGESAREGQRGTSPLATALEDGTFDLGDWLAEELGGDGAADGAGAAAALWPAGDPLAAVLAARAAARAHGAEAAAAATAVTAPAALALRDALPPHAAADAAFQAGLVYQAGFAAGAAAAAAAVGLQPHYVHIKLLQHAAPGQLPLQLPGQLAHLFGGGSSAPVGRLGAAVRPGCTLITLEALLPAGAAPPRAADALRRLLATPEGAGGAFLRAQPQLLVVAGGAELACDAPGAAAAAAAAAEEEVVALAPRTPVLSPLAVLTDCGPRGRAAAIELSYDIAADASAPLPADAAHHCRMACGRVLRVRPLPGGGLALEGGDALGAEGVALFEALPPGVPLHRAAPPRPVLLTRDAGIAAEVAATGEALRALGAGDAARAARAHVERVLATLGAALAAGADADAAVLHAAAAGALWLGWRAALARLLAAPALRDRPDALLALLCHASAAAQPQQLLRVLADVAPLARGARLAAALLAQAQAEGNLRASFAVAAAQEALERRRSSAGADDDDALQPELAAAAAALLGAAAEALDARERRAAARSEAADDVAAAAAAFEVAHAADSADATASGAASASALQPLRAAEELEMFHEQSAAAGVPSAFVYLALVMSADVLFLILRGSILALGPVSVPELMAVPVLDRALVFRVMFIDRSWSCLPASITLLCLLLAPSRRARALYARHATALWVAHSLLHYVLNHLLFEWSFRVWRGVPAHVAHLPRWYSVAFLNMTGAAAMAPARARAVCAVLLLRAALVFAPRAWCLFPVGEPLDAAGYLTLPRVNAALTAAVCAALLELERRSFAAWRAHRTAAAAAAARLAKKQL